MRKVRGVATYFSQLCFFILRFDYSSDCFFHSK